MDLRRSSFHMYRCTSSATLDDERLPVQNLISPATNPESLTLRHKLKTTLHLGLEDLVWSKAENSGAV